MFNPLIAIENGPYAHFGRYLHPQHFGLFVVVAVVLHALGGALYYYTPEEEVEEIPVRVMNVKLSNDANGNASITSKDINRLFARRRLAEPVKALAPAVVEAAPAAVTETPAPAPSPETTPAPVARGALERVVPDEPIKKAEPVAKPITKEKKTKPKAKTKEQEHSPKRFVRESEKAAPATASDGKQESAGQLRSSYTRSVSQWLDRFKIYPEAARAKGEGGKVVLRLRINRQGRVLRYLLQQSSGSEAIDRSITQMVEAANPLPAVPDDYPDKKSQLEFLIPIHFIP